LCVVVVVVGCFLLFLEILGAKLLLAVVVSALCSIQGVCCFGFVCGHVGDRFWDADELARRISSLTSFLEAFELELQLFVLSNRTYSIPVCFFLFAQMLGLLSSAKDGTITGLLFPLHHRHARSHPLIMASFH
jgi:hypothetical protein